MAVMTASSEGVKRDLPKLLRDAERRVNAHIWPRPGADDHLASIPANPDTDVDLLLMEAAETVALLAAENARLREALQEVVNAGDTDHSAKKMYWAARTALQQSMPQRGTEHE